MHDSVYVVTPAPIDSVAIKGETRRFPVRRIYCVGRNYVDHIREMGGDERQPPFFFQKPSDAIVADNGTVPYPTLTGDFQHEIELVLAIGRGGVDIQVDAAAGHVYGVAVGIDLTRRDVQIEARKAGRPWEIGKSFDHSAPIGDITPLDGAALPNRGAIALRVNDVLRQSGDLAEMIWNPAEIVAELSCQYALEAGDLIFTGTPAGVGAIVAGDSVTGTVDGVGQVTITIG